MNDELDKYTRRWGDLMNARGIAPLGARETASEKAIVEKSTIEEFGETLLALNGVPLKNVMPEPPPLPDFRAKIRDQLVRIELVEFIDAELIETAKYIRSTPSHPLHEESLTFEANEIWFHRLLFNTISNKEARYAKRDEKIDVLLIWNEALELNVVQMDDWIDAFAVPNLSAIGAIYFQSWYHPEYEARPTWSLISHPSIGSIKPKRRNT